MIELEPRETTTGRNKKLFYQIADIMEIKPELYDQTTWGHFLIDTYDLHEKLVEVHGISLDQAHSADETDVLWMDVQECSTVMCIAGHAANLNGWNPTLNHRRTELDWNMVARKRNILRNDDSTRPVEDVARDELGVNQEEADILFDGSAEWDATDIRAFGRGESILDYAIEDHDED